MTRIAIAHDYITQRGGAERVVLAMARAFPDAPIYTTFFDPDHTFSEFAELDVRPSFLNRWRWLRRHHRAALFVLPLISSAIKIDADVVVVSSTGWAHGFRTTGPSIVYCHSPARWIYQSEAYLGDKPPWLVTSILSILKPFLRWWDRRAAKQSGDYIANSTVVRKRILDAYGKQAIVVPAPHLVDPEGPSQSVAALDEWLDGSDYYLCVSRLLPYKNVDAIVEALRARPDRKLVIVGAGPEESRLRSMAPAQVRFLQALSDAQMRAVYTGCSALIAASYEDFGLTPVEAASFGKPSIVLRWGGFLDTMVDGVTAVFFDKPEASHILRAIESFEAAPWNIDKIKDHARSFDEATFAATLAEQVALLEDGTTV